MLPTQEKSMFVYSPKKHQNLSMCHPKGNNYLFLNNTFKMFIN